jgi:hypothetical protein
LGEEITNLLKAWSEGQPAALDELSAQVTMNCAAWRAAI